MSSKKVFGSPYAHKRYIDYKVSEPSLTQQQFASETDINYMVAKMQKGQFLQTQSKQPVFGQTFRPNQYEDAIITVREAQNQFNALPSHIRDRFKNDPSRLVEFIQNEDNTDEAIKLGLVDVNKFSDDKKEFYNSSYYKNGVLTFKDFYSGKYETQKAKDFNFNQQQASTVTPTVNGGVNEPVTH